MADKGGGGGGGGSSSSSFSSSIRDSSSSLSAPLRPTITLPPRSSMETLFTGGPGASPGPMTLVSSFFSDNDPDSDCPSFSQLLAGAMASPAAIRPSFPPPLPPDTSSSKDNNSGGDADFRFKQNRPSGLVIAQPQPQPQPQPPMFTIPPGLSPASLLDSPGFFSPGQGPFGMSHQQALAQVTAQAVQAQAQMHIQAEYPPYSAAPTALLPQHSSFTSNTAAHQHIPAPILDPNIAKESLDVSYSDQRSQLSAFAVDKPASAFAVDKPADDGYNWRKYGQKQVKGSEFPRSYYKCTHSNCPVKKKVERSLDGQVTEIIYKGQHNHPPPQPNKRAKDTGHPNGASHLQENSNLGAEVQMGTLSRVKDGVPPQSLLLKDQELSQATHLSRSSDSEEAGDAETRVDERDEDEPESKRRNTEVRVPEPASSHRTVTEPRIIVQTTSEVDLLDDGYRWRKYGQKVVKGNPYPRSYYKCTHPGCNVRKHVERAASDPKAVITTYEGKHNHDVPAAKGSSHNAASNTASQLKQQNAITDQHTLLRGTELVSNNQQAIGLLRFKEEQIT